MDKWKEHEKSGDYFNCNCRSEPHSRSQFPACNPGHEHGRDQCGDQRIHLPVNDSVTDATRAQEQWSVARGPPPAREWFRLRYDAVGQYMSRPDDESVSQDDPDANRDGKREIAFARITIGRVGKRHQKDRKRWWVAVMPVVVVGDRIHVVAGAGSPGRPKVDIEIGHPSFEKARTDLGDHCVVNAHRGYEAEQEPLRT